MTYGKFNSAEELLKGYEELEKSFTQKCQRLSALEKQYGGTSADGAPPQSNDAKAEQSAVTVSDTVPVQASSDASLDADTVSVKASAADVTVEQYPAGANASVQPCPLQDNSVPRAAPKVMTAGGNVSMALPNRPATLKEASELAKEYFK